jgi:DNA (cytosine-5)-methyltransferase 1
VSAYYNDNDPTACAWLRELIAAGLIAPGDVDERSIADVQPTDLVGYTQCHFFAGIGGWSYALRLAGWPDDRPVWTGSCPCQPFSCAGKGLGISDHRHLWPELRRLVAECRPPVVFGEQVASRAGREWISGVRADMEGMAYAVGGADLCAACLGAPHIRQRLYWVADAVCSGRPEGWPVAGGGPGPLGDTLGTGLARRSSESGDDGAQQPTAERAGRDAGGVGGAWTETPLVPSGRMGDAILPRREALDREPIGGEARPGEPSHTGFWSAYALIHCRDGKARRIPDPGRIIAEPDVFGVLSDGVSIVLGAVWDEGLRVTKAKVAEYAKATGAGSREVLRALRFAACEKEVREHTGRRWSFSETEVLLVALLKLEGYEEQEDRPAASDLREHEGAMLRAVWGNPGGLEELARASRQRRLDGPQARKCEDALRTLPSCVAQAEGKGVLGMRGEGEGPSALLETLSAVEGVWRSSLDSEKGRKLLHHCDGWSRGLGQFPLAPKVPGRVGLLKGFGNAIVPHVAAAFITAYCEVKEDR